MPTPSAPDPDPSGSNVRAAARRGTIRCHRRICRDRQDFKSVARGALRSNLGDGLFLVAGLESIVAFKRLAGRPRDRNDLLELEERHGPLPIVPIPGLDLHEKN